MQSISEFVNHECVHSGSKEDISKADSLFQIMQHLGIHSEKIYTDRTGVDVTVLSDIFHF